MLRGVHPLALERFCERVLTGIEGVVHNGAIERWHASSMILNARMRL